MATLVNVYGKAPDQWIELTIDGLTHVFTIAQFCVLRGQVNTTLDAIQCPPPKDGPDANPT